MVDVRDVLHAAAAKPRRDVDVSRVHALALRRRRAQLAAASAIAATLVPAAVFGTQLLPDGRSPAPASTNGPLPSALASTPIRRDESVPRIGRIVRYVGPAQPPRGWGVPTAALGAVWIPGGDGQRAGVVRLNAETLHREGMVAMPGNVASIAVLDDTLWVTTESGELCAVDPVEMLRTSCNRLGQPPDNSDGLFNLGPLQVAAGFGVLWLDQQIDQRKLLRRFDPAVRKVTGTVRLPTAAGAITFGPRWIWVGAYEGPLLMQVDPITLQVRRQVSLVGVFNEGIAAVPGGVVAGVRGPDHNRGYIAHVSDAGTVRLLSRELSGAVTAGPLGVFVLGHSPGADVGRIARLDSRGEQVVSVGSTESWSDTPSPYGATQGLGRVWAVGDFLVSLIPATPSPE